MWGSKTRVGSACPNPWQGVNKQVLKYVSFEPKGGERIWCSHHVLNVFPPHSQQFPMTLPFCSPSFHAFPKLRSQQHHTLSHNPQRPRICFGFWCSHHVLNLLPPIVPNDVPNLLHKFSCVPQAVPNSTTLNPILSLAQNSTL